MSSASSAGGRPRLSRPTLCRSATPRLRAEKLHATGRYAGVDAYSVTCDEEAGEYGASVFHARLGRVPEFEE